MSEPTTPAEVEFHWVMTVQLDSGQPATCDGVVTVDLPASRSELYQWVKGAMCRLLRDKGVNVNATLLNVVFFDAQPNSIIPAGAR